MYQHNGIKAERVAARWLRRRGHKLVDHNWRTRSAEIDIITVLGDSIFFVEVKYHRHQGGAGGIEYVDARKQKRMLRASLMYLLEFPHLDDYAPRLAVIEVGGLPMRVENYIDDVAVDTD